VSNLESLDFYNTYILLISLVDNSAFKDNVHWFYVGPKKTRIKLSFHVLFLSVVFYACGTCWLTLREEHRIRVFENVVLRRIFGPNRDEVSREWRKLHRRSLVVCTSHKILFG
jgi:hypothetical protein